ncbi:MAG: protein-methionine-sulfoxide reductase catalytic subunit MsrP [Rhodospirillales bacterium]|nr:protein-methionine-sulfoxide reductase catalytic subunit MsrP [Rhodospirillales bacterium]
MLIKRRRGWEIPEREATPEAMFWSRRKFAATLAAGPMLLASRFASAEDDPTAALYPAKRNLRYTLDRPITDARYVEGYNNFYEFGSHKEIARAAQALKVRPWQVKFDGLVEAERVIDADDLIRAMPLEERLYRLRCVEAWSMAVPWTGFPMKALVEFAKPLGSAKYVRMETFTDARVAPGQKQFWYPWPYVEGLTMAEATNELAFIVTGAYGRPLAKQNGAPLRLSTPWKYGFKHIKSIVRFTFTEERPVGFWEKLQASEYGFWANVNPDVPHPRWSQKTERVVGTDERRPTLIYNGYGEFVADLYKGLENERLFA